MRHNAGLELMLTIDILCISVVFTFAVAGCYVNSFNQQVTESHSNHAHVTNLGIQEVD